MKKLILLLVLLGMGLSTTGCVLGVVAAAGAIAVDEANENDGEFDPFEEAYDGDPSTAGPLDKEDK